MPMNDTDPQDTLLTPYEGRSILAVPIALLIAIPLYRVVGSLAGGLSLAGIFSVWWLAIPSFGESWHNLHHADPTSARHGVLRGQIDSSARVIWLLEKAGWASDVRWPKAERLDAKRA